MIVRTYGRRNRCISRSYSDLGFNGGDVDDTFTDSLSQSQSQEPDIHSFNFSSQDSSPWTFDPDIYGSNSQSQGGGVAGGSLPSIPSIPSLPPRPESSSQNGLKAKKGRNSGKNGVKELKNGSIAKGVRSMSMPAATTSTLMEAQEFGEMMEHVDEVNFALDGLRKAQPARIRRASLLSLLSICATATQRRLLRTNGMAKIILDAILALSLDDSPSTLAAAALFYILASDSQDEHLLDSPICIRFLLKLLSPSNVSVAEHKRPTLGSKLLALCKDPVIMGEQGKKSDSSSTVIISKVQEILLSCKEIQESNRNDEGIGRPELNPKWIALLTMEKACLSTVSLEDTCGAVRKVGGNFKERLRELGGLDAVFNVAINCHSVMEGWSEHSLRSICELKDELAFQTVVLLLKCLKIMENATFLSKDNQDHLLEMNGKMEKGSSVSFTGLVISFIRILSGLSVNTSSSVSSGGISCCPSAGMVSTSECPSTIQEVDGILSGNSSKSCYSTDKSSHVEGSRTSRKRQRLSSRSVYSISSSETAPAFTTDSCSLKKRSSNSTSSSCNGTARSSNGAAVRSTCGPKMNLGLGKKPIAAENTKCTSIEDSQDPFAFDEDEFVPSKWDNLSKRKEVPHVRKSREIVREVENGCQPQQMTSNSESIEPDAHSCEVTCSPPSNDGNSEILADCLLTAVKVLMNLTNDNPVGCKQIAAYGGLETLTTLIIRHFPSYSSLSQNSRTEEPLRRLQSSAEVEYQNDKHFNDHELDFLVAILGLLVNLVEKDSLNRSRLAAASVLLSASQESGAMDSHRDVIPLLCSIFLANQGSGEAAGEGRPQPLDDEVALLQSEREAEKMIIEAYAALLLAFLSTESKDVREAIACCLPDNNLEVLVPVLERFVEFHLTLNMISPETHKAVSEVIESCRGP